MTSDGESVKDRSTTTNRSWLRSAQILCIVLGTLLLGWYLVARSHSFFASKTAMERFEDAKSARLEVTPYSSSNSSSPSADPVDTTLWAEGRIEEFQYSLLAEMDTPLAILRIPRLEIEVPVFAGTSDLVLNRGVGHIEGTALPGQIGNIGIAGHRDGFFRPLKDIAVGDTLVLESLGKTTTFIVEELQIVVPTDVWVLEPTEKPSVTLVTCYPFYFVGSAPQRFIVRADSSEPTPS
jgi:sortase A